MPETPERPVQTIWTKEELDIIDAVCILGAGRYLELAAELEGKSMPEKIAELGVSPFRYAAVQALTTAASISRIIKYKREQIDSALTKLANVVEANCDRYEIR